MQPLGQVKLESCFSTPTADVFVGSRGFNLIKSGLSITAGYQNPSYTGSRFIARPSGVALRHYSDHGSNNDDYYIWPSSISFARAVDFTTVVCWEQLNTGGYEQSVLPYRSAYSRVSTSHFIKLDDDGNLALGYQGGNGFEYFYNGAPPTTRLDTVHCAVISTSFSGKALSIAFDGSALTATNGSSSYIGGGNNATSGQPTTAGADFSEYYNFNSYLFLWANIPGLFINQAVAVDISKDPYRLLVPA
jgi:hypothetical protein